jgi:hypothetical protein
MVQSSAIVAMKIVTPGEEANHCLVVVQVVVLRRLKRWYVLGN